MGREEAFSVRSIKDALHKSNENVLNNLFFWNNWIHKKVNFMVWRVSLDGLPTKVALNVRRYTRFGGFKQDGVRFEEMEKDTSLGICNNFTVYLDEA
ncbi:hypothetical protein R6Q59_020719 [Mikania micrantha]